MSAHLHILGNIILNFQSSFKVILEACKSLFGTIIFKEILKMFWMKILMDMNRYTIYLILDN